MRNLAYLYGDYGTMIRSTDEWLRLNDGTTHTNGTYTSGLLRADGGLYVGDDEYFYRDAEDRIATSDDFYVQAASANTYLYSTNTYLGSTSGDNIRLRDNQMYGDDWIINDGGAGSWGIGTTVPSTQLHTTGGVRFAGMAETTDNTRIVTVDASGNLRWREPGYWTNPNLWTIVEDFESGTWPWSPWVAYASGGTINTNLTYVHDGTRSIYNPGWHYRTDVSLGMGEKLSAWIYLTSATGGRAYIGFAASSGGCFSAVAAPNTNEFIIMQNSGYGYTDVATAAHTYGTGWYRIEVEIVSSSEVVAKLYDSGGSTALETISYSSVTGLPGGIAIRSFGDVYIDTIEIMGSATFFRAAERDATEIPTPVERPPYRDRLRIGEYSRTVTDFGNSIVGSDVTEVSFERDFAEIMGDAAVNISAIGGGSVSMTALDRAGFMVSGDAGTRFSWTAFKEGEDAQLKERILITRFGNILLEEGILPEAVFAREPNALSYDDWKILAAAYGFEIPSESAFERILTMDRAERLNGIAK